METYKSEMKNLFTAVYMGDLKEVKRIYCFLSKMNPTWYPDYYLLCVSFLHKHTDIARFFLSKNCVVVGDNEKNYKGYSALHSAVLHGDSALVRTILEKGASHNSRNIDGLSPLHLVVYRNPAISRSGLSSEEFDKETSQIINTLLQYGVNINAGVYCLSKYGFTSLHLAVECGNERIIPQLISKKADLNAKSETGLTPLHVAVISRNLRMVNLLLKVGVMAYSKDKRGNTPLCWAIKQRQLEMVDIFLNYKPSARKNKLKSTPTIKDDYYALSTAVKMDNFSIVESLLSKGAIVNTHWKNGTTPLHIAAENGSKDILQILLDYGADVTAVSQDGKTPLHVAVEKECIEIVKILLNCVSDINSTIALQAVDGSTPLHIAIRKNNEEIIRLLLQKGYQSSDDHQCMESPLHIAVMKNQINILKILLKNGFDLKTTDMYGRTALQVASGHGSLESVKEFCDIYSKNGKKWKEGYAALYFAALNGRVNIVKLLLDRGADLNARTDNFSTPLFVAAEKGHINIVKLLLENGANVNELRYDGKTALHCAVEKQFCEVVECLITNGANVNVKARGDSPLHSAAKMKDLNIVKLLVQNGADINGRNINNATPLFIAVQGNRNSIVHYLVKNAADVNIADQDSTIKSFNYSSDCIYDLRTCKGLRPLTVAVDNSNLELVEILLKHGSPTNIRYERILPLHLASANGSLEIVKRLLAFGADINSICEQNHTPLSHAIANGKTDTFIWLLPRALVFRYNPRNSLLHLALKSVQKDEYIVDLLLNSGADVEARDVDYKTPLHCAISFGNREDQKYLFELLLDYGSEINAIEKAGNTPLHIAAQEGDFVAAEVLLNYGANINAINKAGNTALQYLVNEVKDELFLYLYRNDFFACPYAFIAKSMVSMITFLESAGRKVNKQNLELVKSVKFINFYKKCKQELSVMKSMKVGHEISYYEILMKSDRKLVYLVHNSDIVQKLESIDLKDMFPCYDAMLKSRVRMAKERRELLHSCEEQLTFILKFKFPIIVVDEILNYMSFVDMKTMMRVLRHRGHSFSKFLKPIS